MNRIGHSELNQYVALAEDRRLALREAAETYRLARLAQLDDLSAVQRMRLRLARLLMALGRRLAAGLDEGRPHHPLSMAR